MNEEATAHWGLLRHKKKSEEATQTELNVTQMIPLLCTWCTAGVYKLSEL